MSKIRGEGALCDHTRKLHTLFLLVGLIHVYCVITMIYNFFDKPFENERLGRNVFPKTMTVRLCWYQFLHVRCVYSVPLPRAWILQRLSLSSTSAMACCHKSGSNKVCLWKQIIIALRALVMYSARRLGSS